MLKLNKLCAVCKLIEAGDKRLEDRINTSTAWNPAGESLQAIYRDYNADGRINNDRSLYTHAKKHQAPKKSDYKKLQTKLAVRDIEGEVALAKAKDPVYRHHSEARRELIQAGMEALENGDMKMTASALTALLKQDADIEEKSKDRSLELMKMFNFFASGSNKERPDEAYAGRKNYVRFDPSEDEVLIPRETY